MAVHMSYSYILEDGICYLALCDPTYPAKLAFSYLENLHKDFSEQHGNDVHRASRPYHFIEFGEHTVLLWFGNTLYITASHWYLPSNDPNATCSAIIIVLTFCLVWLPYSRYWQITCCNEMSTHDTPVISNWTTYSLHVGVFVLCLVCSLYLVTDTHQVVIPAHGTCTM